MQIQTTRHENYKYLSNLIPATFLQTAKQKMVKDLMIMIFGPKDGPVAIALNPNAAERDYLINHQAGEIGKKL